MAMRKFSRRRRWSLKFWILGLAMTAVSANAYFGWLPVEFGGTKTGELTNQDLDSQSDVSDGITEPDAFDATDGFVPLDPDDIRSMSLQRVPFDDQDESGFARSATAQSSQSLFRDQLRDEPRVNPFSANERAAIPHAIRNRRTLPAPSPFVPPTDADTLNSNRRLPPDRAANGIVQTSNETEQDGVTAPVRTANNATTKRRDGKSNTVAAKDTSRLVAAVDLRSIDRLIEASEDVAALRELSKVYWSNPELRPMIQKRIETLANAVYFSPQPHYLEPYVVQPGDQLRKIAKGYRVPWEYLAKLNRVDPRKIRAGQKLKVVKGPFSAAVDLSAFEVIIHAHGYYVRKYRVGIGKDGASPIGKFKVLEKFVDPQYTDPEGRVIDGGAKNNPLGNRWIGIGDGFGIHGTIKPESIGRAESRGCIRMINTEAAEVFDLLEVGSEVVIQR